MKKSQLKEIILECMEDLSEAKSPARTEGIKILDALNASSIDADRAMDKLENWRSSYKPGYMPQENVKLIAVVRKAQMAFERAVVNVVKNLKINFEDNGD